MDFSSTTATACLLLDNGSLQPAATLALRRLAAELSERIGVPVAPVSVLHSNKVPAAELEGVQAEALLEALRVRAAAGVRRFLIVPLFFGPSGALVDYVPGQARMLEAEFGRLDLRIAALVAGHAGESPDPRVAKILVDHARAVIRERRLDRPIVVVVDHGSPQRVVTQVRDGVAAQVTAMLGTEVRLVVAASMERRAGAAYDFNDPLLERALTAAPCGPNAGDVVLAPLFFTRGRHAGPGGDIETIARAAETNCPGLRVHVAPVVGDHPRLVEILEDRYRAAVKSAS